MKNKIFTAFKILIALVLIGKILNWFLNFSQETNQQLNMAMFSLIGIAYVVMSYSWNQQLLRIGIMSCGLFLIVMNFFPATTPLEIVGIVCILAPMLIARFYKEKTAAVHSTKS